MSLQITKNLIEIDGPDGSGKSTLAKDLLFFFLRDGFSASRHSVTNFHDMPWASRAQRIFDDNKIQPTFRSLFYRSLTRIYYRSVISPLIQSDEIVVVDRSVHKLFMYAFLDRDELLRNKLRRDYSSGNLTFGLVPATRINILPKPSKSRTVSDVIWGRMSRKIGEGTINADDPHTFDEVALRVQASNDAWAYMTTILQATNLDISGVFWNKFADSTYKDERYDIVSELYGDIVKVIKN